MQVYLLCARCPEDAGTFAMDAQWMLGEALLVAPVVAERQSSVHVYLPAEGEWGYICIRMCVWVQT